MKHPFKTLAFSAFMLIPAVQMASAADTATTRYNPTTMTCEQYLTLDAQYRPQVIYWLDGYNRHGQEIQAEGFTLVPADSEKYLTQACEQDRGGIVIEHVKTYKMR